MEEAKTETGASSVSKNAGGPFRFWRGVFSESDGSPSFSRIASGLSVMFSLGWVTHLVVTNHALPDLGGVALLSGTLYGVNKFSGAVGSFGRNPQ